MNIFKKRPTPEPLPLWADYAPRLEAMAYCPLPIEASQISRGLSQPAGGGWAFGLAQPPSPDLYTAGVLCGRLPHGAVGLDDCKASWICAVHIDVESNARVARELEAVVRAYVGDSPVRECIDSTALLLVARIDTDPRAFNMSTGHYALPGDKRFSHGNSVRLESAGACFLAAGWRYRYRGGIDLTVTPRASLPLLTDGATRELVGECDRVLGSRKVPEPPSPRAQLLENARRRSQAEA